jgi:hypothetical protein
MPSNSAASTRAGGPSGCTRAASSSGAPDQSVHTRNVLYTKGTHLNFHRHLVLNEILAKCGESFMA